SVTRGARTRTSGTWVNIVSSRATVGPGAAGVAGAACRAPAGSDRGAAGVLAGSEMGTARESQSAGRGAARPTAATASRTAAGTERFHDGGRGMTSFTAGAAR